MDELTRDRLLSLWQEGVEEYRLKYLNQVKRALEENDWPWDELGLSHNEFETKKRKCLALYRAIKCWDTAFYNLDMSAFVQMHSALTAAGAKIERIYITQFEYDDLKRRLWINVCERDLATCRRSPSVVLAEYIPLFMEKGGLTFDDLSCDEEELHALKAQGHLSQAKVVLGFLRKEPDRSRLSLALYHLEHHQRLALGVICEEEETFPYDFSLIDATREEFADYWKVTAPDPRQTEMLRRQLRAEATQRSDTPPPQQGLFSDIKPQPRKRSCFRWKKKKKASGCPRSLSLFPTK